MTLLSALRAVERLCATELDARRLMAQVIEHLHGVIDFRWHVWVLTDPRTCVGAAPLAVVPDLRELPLLVRLKYRTETNRWTNLPGGQAVGLAAGGPPSRSALWEGVQRRHGVTDVLSLVLRDAYGCWAFLDLWRTGGSDRETQLLQRLLAGERTRELAASLHISEHTVQDHLKSIFTKTGTRTRPGLAARALGVAQ